MFKNFKQSLIPSLGFLLLAMSNSSNADWQSKTTRGWAYTGGTDIVSETIRATITPTHLTVETELQLRPGSFGWQSLDEEQKTTLEVVGNLALPPDAVVTGALIWNGDRILHAKLKSSAMARSQYEKVVDRNTQQVIPRDPILLEKNADGSYQFSVYPFNEGQVRKIRYQYIVPLTVEKGRSKVTLPNREHYETEVQLKGNGIEAVYIPQIGTRRVPCTIPGSVSEIQLTRTNTQATQAYVDHNGFKGHILDYQGKVPDALMKAGGAFKEFVILWHWNDPGAINQYGNQLINQGQLIQSFIMGIHPTWHKAALIIDPGVGEPLVENLASRAELLNTATVQDLNLFSSSLALTETVNPWPANPSPKQIDSIASMGREAFSTAFSKAKSLFSNDTLTKKYIVVITLGNQNVMSESSLLPVGLPAISSKNTKINFLGLGYSENEISDEYHFAAVLEESIRWPGMNLEKIIRNDEPEVKKVIGRSVGIPFDWPLNVWMEMKSANKSIKLLTVDPLKEQNWAEANSHIRIHSHLGPWEPKIRWIIGDENKEQASIYENIEIKKSTDSIGLAMIWAGGSFMKSTSLDVNKSLATGLGYVDENYSLLALENNTLTKELESLYQTKGMPWLERKDIFVDPNASTLRLRTPDESKTEYLPWENANGATAIIAKAFQELCNAKIHQAFLELQFAQGNDLKSLEVTIYDMRGQIVGRWSAKDLVNNTLHITQWSKLNTGAYHLQIKLQGKAFSKSLVKS